MRVDLDRDQPFPWLPFIILCITLGFLVYLVMAL